MRSIEAKPPTTVRPLSLLAPALFGVLLFAACDADSPTAPRQPATPVPVAPTPTNLSLSLSADPGQITIADTPIEVFIRVSAVRADNGQPAPDNSTVILSTTLGLFVSAADDGTEVLDRSVIVRTSSGQAVGILRFQPGDIGSAVVQGQLNTIFGQTVVQVEEFVPPPGPPPPDPFFVAEVVPNAGNPSGGYTVQVIGSGFDPPFRVLFGGVPAPVRSSTESSLTVEVPPFNLPVGQFQTIPVSVTINLNDTDPEATSLTDILPSAFTYTRDGGGGGPLVPQIISVTPSSGPNEGGTQVTIRGEGFGDEVQVFFSGGALVEAEVLSASPTRVVVRTPSATGSNFGNLNAIVDVRVRNLASGQEAVLPGGFQYGDGAGGQGLFISSAGPGRGPYTGGTVVTIFGSGFEEPVAVEFGGFAQERISVTGTEIIARSVKVPLDNCSETSGPFGVTNVETSESFQSGILFTYFPIMVSISGIAPDATTTDLFGNVTGPTTFTMSGVSGFDVGDPVTVTFGDVFAFGVVFDPSTGTLSGQIPPFTGTYATQECDLGGGVTGTQLTPARVDVRIRNEFTGCELNLTARFTYTPSPNPCVAAPPPPPPPAPAPTASFTRSPPGDVMVGETVFFTDTSLGMPDTWQWSFGDGMSSGLQNPSHSYGATGTYTVTLIVSNASGSSSTTMDITVVP